MEKKEKEVGKVNHWYDKIGVSVVKLSGTLSVGDKVKVKKGKEVAIKVSGGDAKDGSLVFKL